MWGIWSSGSPGRVAGRADGVAPASASSSASVADVLLAGQLFLLCTSILLGSDGDVTPGHVQTSRILSHSSGCSVWHDNMC